MGQKGKGKVRSTVQTLAPIVKDAPTKEFDPKWEKSLLKNTSPISLEDARNARAIFIMKDGSLRASNGGKAEHFEIAGSVESEMIGKKTYSGYEEFTKKTGAAKWYSNPPNTSSMNGTGNVEGYGKFTDAQISAVLQLSKGLGTVSVMGKKGIKDLKMPSLVDIADQMKQNNTASPDAGKIQKMKKNIKDIQSKIRSGKYKKSEALFITAIQAWKNKIKKLNP
jgi:hypothetical protein